MIDSQTVPAIQTMGAAKTCSPGESHDVEAAFSFLHPRSASGGDEMLVSVQESSLMGSSEPIFNFRSQLVPDIPIRDARPIMDSLSLDKQGFVTMDCSDFQVQYEDPNFENDLRRIFIPGLRRKLKATTGAQQVWFEGAVVCHFEPFPAC